MASLSNCSTIRSISAKLSLNENSVCPDRQIKFGLTAAKFPVSVAKSLSGTSRVGVKNVVCMSLMGEDPEWSDDDYLALGLAHCFVKDDNSKLQDEFVIEPIPAGALECMENGGVTSYKFVTAVGLGTALKQDGSALPTEFQAARFCEDFEYRAKCSARTWKRQHAEEIIK